MAKADQGEGAEFAGGAVFVEISERFDKACSAFVLDRRFDRARAEIGKLDLDCYEVGGSIRDQLGAGPAKDLDVAVVGSDAAELIYKLSRVGQVTELSVAGAVIGARLQASWTPVDGIEFALARTEVSSGDGHHDFEIVARPTVSLKEDLARRDFTCNAIAAPIRSDGSLGPLIDPYRGSEDIAAGELREVGPTTIAEDPLRALRGFVRVAAKNWQIEAGTLESIKAVSGKLGPDGELSAERIYAETEKIIRGDHPAQAFRLMRDCGVFAAAYPELAPMVNFDQQSRYHDLPVDEHCFRALEVAAANQADPVVRWAALLHDSGKPETAFMGTDDRLHYYRNPLDPDSVAHEVRSAEISRALLERFRAPKKFTSEVELLVRNHMFSEDHHLDKRSDTKNRIKVRRLIRCIGRENIYRLSELRHCDRLGKTESEDSWQPNRFDQLIDEEINQPLFNKDLVISGHDLLALGARGPEIGAIQTVLVERVVVNPEMNEPATLLSWAKKELSRIKRAEQRS